MAAFCEKRGKIVLAAADIREVLTRPELLDYLGQNVLVALDEYVANHGTIDALEIHIIQEQNERVRTHHNSGQARRLRSAG